MLELRIMIRNSDIDRLRGLFAKRLIATMDMLKKTVGTVADLAVFRKLRELDYCTSYSHRGRFYTLRELAEFDENGLWWIRSVGFSSRGTLVATAEGLVNASEAYLLDTPNRERPIPRSHAGEGSGTALGTEKVCWEARRLRLRWKCVATTESLAGGSTWHRLRTRPECLYQRSPTNRRAPRRGPGGRHR